MAASGTSFQKRSRVKVPQISGTKPSLHNNQLLISSGVPSLDNVVGGGLAVGTVLLIEEDTYGSYSKMVLKYFLAEGIMNKHGLVFASGDVEPVNFINELPGPLVDDPGSDQIQSNESSDMTIAWRYQNQGKVKPGTAVSRFGHYYDLTKMMDPKVVKDSNIANINVSDVPCHCGEEKYQTMTRSYSHLLNKIKQKIDEDGFGTAANSPHKNVLRIAIHSLGSPQWGGLRTDRHGTLDPSLCRFLYALRSIMRTSYATCVVTVPTHLFPEPCLTRRVENLSDTVLRLESFIGSDKEKNPAFKDYHGLFHIVKLPRLNTLNCHMPDTLDLAFKLRKKKFMIEKLHLPPELSETVSRSQEDPILPKTSGCGSGPGTNKLDF